MRALKDSDVDFLQKKNHSCSDNYFQRCLSTFVIVRSRVRNENAQMGWTVKPTWTWNCQIKEHPSFNTASDLSWSSFISRQQKICCDFNVITLKKKIQAWLFAVSINRQKVKTVKTLSDYVERGFFLSFVEHSYIVLNHKEHLDVWRPLCWGHHVGNVLLMFFKEKDGSQLSINRIIKHWSLQIEKPGCGLVG